MLSGGGHVRILLFCLALLAVGPSGASAEEAGGAIRWLLTGVPPKLIPDGPFRGKGYGEEQVALLSRLLPRYAHRVETVTPARLWYELRTGQGVCSVDIAQLPERERWAVFTRHQTSIPSYRLLVLRDRLPEFNEFRDAGGEVDLDRLAASDRLTGIYVTSRYYMPRINGFIEAPGHGVHLEAVSASTRIFEMVASRRGDFAFASLTEMNYFSALNRAAPPGGKPWPPLAMLPIKGADEQVHGHIACSRDALGRQMVEDVDRLFDDPAVWAEFLAPERRWMDEAPLAP